MLRGVLIAVFGYIVAVNSIYLREKQGISRIHEISLPVESDEQIANYTICETEQCEKIARLISKGINKTAKPCDDFYSYVCGSWIDNFPVPKDKFLWNMDKMTEKRIYSFMKKTVEKKASLKDSVPLRLEKKWFNACMNEERIEKKGLEPLINIIEGIGGWPMAMSSDLWNKKKKTWQKVAQYYANIIDGYSLFNIGIKSDAKNSSVQIITIDEPSSNLFEKRLLGNRRGGFRFNKLSKDDDENGENDGFKYSELIQHVVEYYSNATGRSPEDIVHDINHVVNFETSLGVIKASPVEKNDLQTKRNIMTISEFQKYYNDLKPGRVNGKINWLEMIQAWFKGSEIEIDASERINIPNLSYFKKLISLLRRTTIRTVVNFIHWDFVNNVLKYSDSTMSQWYLDTINYNLGIKQNSPRWRECLEEMPINQGLSFEYVKQYYPQRVTRAATDMAEGIRDEIGHEISKTKWLNNNSRGLVMMKLKAMEMRVGFPEWYKNRDEFNAVYDGLVVGPDYFQNFLNYVKFIGKNTKDDYRSPIDKKQWYMSPITSNAYYLPTSNSVDIPAAQLLITLFNSEAPAAVSYGSVGFIIGHEINHAFDDTGRKFDKNGNVVPWLSDAAVKEWKNRTDCFVEQFNDYKVNGKVTQGENIADTAGLKAAFGAYRRKMNREKIEDLRLPGLENFDENQLFFVAFGSSFCQSATEEYLIGSVNDAHTVAPVRINGAVANVDEFAEAFRCKKGSLLNKNDKCYLW